MMLEKTKVVRYSHGFYVKPGSKMCREALLEYCRTLIQWEYQKKPPTWRPQRVAKKVFAAATKDRTEFRFHINQYQELMTHLSAYGLKTSNMEFDSLPAPKSVSAEYVFNKKITPYEYQEPIIDFLSQPDKSIKVTNLQTGGGKTLTALIAMVNLGQRTLIQLRGGYVSRWTDELELLFKFKKGDILVIRGRDSLMSLINMAKEGELKAKIIIITNKTLFKFFQEYEENPNTNYYDCRPEELYELIQCGLRIVDEVHEDYHFNFRSDIYCNIQSSIMLSATLETEDPFRRRMYDIAMPKECWYHGVDYVKYIDVYCAFYHMQDADNVRTSERGQDTYNHGAFEKSIMKEPNRLEAYLEMIEDLVRRHYLLFEWGPNQKFLVFCYLVEFCELVRDHLQQAFPDVRISEYVSGTPDEVLTRSEGLVSTVKSLGTAMDIKGLKTTIQTHALNKQESNIQALGRLRRMKQYPNLAPRFVYLTCQDIPKHMEYHENKRKQFHGKVARHLEEHLNFVV